MNDKRVGLHLDNKAPIDEPTWTLMRDLDVAGVVVMDDLPDEDLDRLARDHPGAHVYCRVWLDNQHTTPGYYENFFYNLAKLVGRVRERFPADQVHAHFFNEQQMGYEGFGQSLTDMLNWQTAYLKGYAYLKNIHPDVAIGFDPLTAGNHDVRVATDPPEDKFFMEECQEALQRCDEYCAHIYSEWSDPAHYLAPWWGRRHDLYRQYFPANKKDMAIYITECSIGDQDQDARPTATIDWLRQVIEPDDQVKIVFFWIGNAPGNPMQDPNWDRARLLNDNGTRRPISDALVAYVREAPVPTPEPPQPEEETEPMSVTITFTDQVIVDNEDLFRAWAPQGVPNNFRTFKKGQEVQYDPNASVSTDDLLLAAGEVKAKSDELNLLIARYPFPSTAR